MMEQFSDLLFELSHEDRLKIFHMINKNPAKLTHLSEKLNLQVQETARHLSRLSEAKLISKDADGFYRPTPYGDYVIRLLPGFEFLRKRRNHLLTRKSPQLPEEFISRIGELNKSTFTEDMTFMFQEAKASFEEAKEYYWILSDHIHPDTVAYLTTAMERGVKVRLLFPKDMSLPSGFQPIPFIPNRIERKTIEHVNIGIMMNERKATIGLPNSYDRLDHSGFVIADEISHKWCKDLFEYYWERAKIGPPSGLYQETKQNSNRKSTPDS